MVANNNKSGNQNGKPNNSANNIQAKATTNSAVYGSAGHQTSLLQPYANFEKVRVIEL